MIFTLERSDKLIGEMLTVKDIRALMKMNQKDFGKLIGMTQSALMRRENGKVKWKMHEVAKVSEVSGLPIQRIKI